jgi:uncharacterized zinc-type alcohol dehydrogenase-like protein
MLPTKSYAAYEPTTPLRPYEFNRRAVGEKDVLIDIHFCGVCHSDLHQARDEWGGATYPMVPGHEIVGKVKQVGSKVEKFKVGDTVGVGCFVDSCRTCPSCAEGVEQYCEKHISFTYNSTEQDQKTATQGGYSTQIVVDQSYVLRVPENLDLAGAAPLLCAGITLYSPLKTWKVGPGTKLAIVGLGGLGHMGVKLGAAMGAEVTVISTSEKKREDASRLGARGFIVSSDSKAVAAAASQFDLIIDTVSAEHDIDGLLGMIKRDGTLVIVGVPPKGIAVHPFSMIPRRRRIAGSMIGGIAETQEMLDFCGKHGIVSDIEKIEMSAINQAYDRMVKGDVRYRFVIDTKTI